ncbi:hypothetical protein FF011L_26910 [Roseimaritima multifibrata]|uniref:Uncharacterized protein n=1 Tax=Roseimaritima multifibrata TaxID=1930274 RepID=A0A517MGA2_9BACT|nr:hypothetical protein FF011L_26910 [Roseimaritima multifibrata]
MQSPAVAKPEQVGIFSRDDSHGVVDFSRIRQRKATGSKQCCQLKPLRWYSRILPIDPKLI